MTPRSERARAAAILQMGPPSLDVENKRRRRYLVTDLLDDLRDARSRDELLGTGARLYAELADYHLRSNGQWSARGKGIPRALQLVNPGLRTTFCESFDKLFRDDFTTPDIKCLMGTQADSSSKQLR